MSPETPRWNYRLRSEGTPPPEALDPSVPYYTERYGVVDCVKSPFENALCIKVFDGVQKVLQKLDLPAVPLSMDRIHFITRQEYDDKIRPKHPYNGPTLDVGGATMYGHIYILKDDPVGLPKDIERALTHEVSHDASAYGIRERVVEMDGEMVIRSGMYRSGLRFVKPPYSKSNERIMFDGVNEAVTEKFAAEVRKELLGLDPEFGRTEGLRWSTGGWYEPHIILLGYLVERVAHATKKSSYDVWQMIYHDYISGSYKFFSVVEKSIPGSVAIISAMGTWAEDAVRTADALGFDEREAADVAGIFRY